MTVSDDKTRPLLGLLVALTVAGTIVGAIWLHLHNHAQIEAGIALAVVLTGGIGGLLVARRPRHPISWLLAGAAVLGAISAVSAGVVPAGDTDLGSFELAMLWVGGPAFFGLFVITVGAIPLLFPTGRPPSPGWRAVLWLGIILYLAFVVLWVVQEEFCEAGAQVCLASNPIGLSGVTNPESGPLVGLLSVCVLGAVASMVVRFRRSRGMERAQLKALVYAVAVFVSLTLFVDGLWSEAFGRPVPSAFEWVTSLLWVTIPASIALAILRYRLYDIDRIISRTVTYALVAGVLAAVFAGGVVAVQAVLPAANDFAVAASTLGVAALFNPLRRRVQRAVDRRFNRSTYQADRVVAAFGERLRSNSGMEDIARDVRQVLTDTLQPASTGLWIRGVAE